MNEKKIVPIVEKCREVIISGSGRYGVTPLENIKIQPYNRCKSVDEPILVYRVVAGINRWLGGNGYSLELVRKVIRAIESMEHVLIRVYWSTKYDVPLMIQTVSYTTGNDYAWLLVPKLESEVNVDE